VLSKKPNPATFSVHNFARCMFIYESVAAPQDGTKTKLWCPNRSGERKRGLALMHIQIMSVKTECKLTNCLNSICSGQGIFCGTDWDA